MHFANAINDYKTLVSNDYERKFAVFEKQVEVPVTKRSKAVIERPHAYEYWTCKESYTALSPKSASKLDLT